MSDLERHYEAKIALIADRGKTYRDCLWGIYEEIKRTRGLDPHTAEMLRCVLYEPDKYEPSSDWQRRRDQNS
jgi:hypothetical protein